MTGLAETAALLSFAATLGGFTFFAPCAFPLLPGYLAFYLGAERDGPSGRRERLVRAGVLGLLASAGFFVVFAVLGGIVAVVGSRTLSGISALELVVGGLLIVLGAAMATGRSPTWRVQLPERRRSATGFFLFGVVYAVAAAGCTAPLFIGVVANGINTSPLVGVGTMLSYAVGMSVVMVGVTGLAAVGREQALRAISSRTGRIEQVAGVLLALAGVTQILYYLFWLGGWAALTG